jgi:hypothetical protein
MAQWHLFRRLFGGQRAELPLLPGPRAHVHPAAFGESQTLVSMFLQVAMLTSIC